MRVRDFLGALALSAVALSAEAPAAAQTTPKSSAAETTTMFPHPDDNAWWLSGQINLIWQTHGRFTSPYRCDNSLRPAPEQALPRLWTIDTGVTLQSHGTAPRHREAYWHVDL
jgi:hypothetical protein